MKAMVYAGGRKEWIDRAATLKVMFAINKYLIAVAGAVALSMVGWGYGQYKYAQGRKSSRSHL